LTIDALAFLVSWPRMRQTTRSRPWLESASALLCACLLAPMPGRAADKLLQIPAVEDETAPSSRPGEKLLQTPTEEEAAPAPAAEEETAPTPTPAEPPAAAAIERPTPAPVPAESKWQEATMRNIDVAIDLAVARPLALVALGAGAVMFVPAALMTAPNGMESVTEAYQRFVQEPGEYFYSRPLGEF
jgi:hypothetical protein